MAFGWADSLVCILMLLVCSGIGVYYRFTGGKQKTTQEFLLASRDASWWSVACSLMATFMSSITILGASSEIYTFGTQFVVTNLSFGLLSPIAAHLYLPVFFKLKTTSAYEYLERRFGVPTRLVASIAFTTQMVLYMGIVVYAPALALEAVTGIQHVYAVIIMGCVCTFYAGMGGMKAVLMTDVFQSVLMFAAVISIIVNGLSTLGFNGIWDIALRHQRIEFDNFSFDPTVRHTWWSLCIGGGGTFLSLYAVNQAQVQRYLSCRDLKTAQKSLYMNWPILTSLSILACFSGLCIFAKYYDCDPLLTKRITSVDQLMPRYVMDTMQGYPGLSGLFVAGIFSGSLSTVSSALNSLSAVTIEDYVKPAVKRIRGRGMSESTSAVVSKLLCFAYGGCCLAVAFVAKYLGQVLQAALTIFGVVGGPVLGTFTLGMFFPMANQTGALSALVISLCFGFWFGFGGPKPPLPALPTWSSEEACSIYDDITITEFRNSTSRKPTTDYLYIYRVSYQWYIILSFLICLSSGLLISWIASKTGRSDAPSHPDLFVPPIARYLAKKRQNVDVNETESQSSDITLKGGVTTKNGVKSIA